MIRGTKTYTLPFSDVEVEVEYFISEDGVCLDCASIGGADLAYEFLGVLIDTTKPSHVIPSSKFIRMGTWLQDKLDEDEGEILGEHGIKPKTDFDEHFNQKDYV